MSINPPRMVNVVCPACRTQYTAPIQSIVDVGREPRFKTLLLQGHLNVGVCPSCGAAGVLSVPFAYHDPEKELLFCLVPRELRVNENGRQHMIGEMSNAIINSLPSERRKGYLLQPRVFLSFQTLVEAILEADGITKEILQAQQEKIQAIEEMTQAVGDSLRLVALISEHKDKVDYEFFALLAASIDAAERGEQADAVGRLTKLREKLLEQTETGQNVARQQKAVEEALEGMDENLTREGLLERIIAIEEGYRDQILNILISLTRPLLDYRFFQLLTERIDKADKEKDSGLVDRLRGLRDEILDLTQSLDAQIRARTEEKARLLVEIVRSEDPRRVIKARMDEIDSIFMSVLETNIIQSEQQHRHDTANMLRSIRDMIADVLQESAPPTVRFINQLLRADYPDGTREMLRENQVMITADLISMMDALSKDLADREEKQTSEQLKGIMAQAQLMI